MNIEEIKKLLFTTEGRIGRKSYIFGSFGSSIAGAIVIGILGFILGSDSLAFMLVAALIYLVLIYASVCMLIKRLHDRNRSGFFSLLSFVPLVNIWIGIETIFLKGTTGANEYGEDPLATSDFVQATPTPSEGISSQAIPGTTQFSAPKVVVTTTTTTTTHVSENPTTSAETK